jgi:hypothetical protein
VKGLYGWPTELAITHDLVGRMEYLYDDFGHTDCFGATGDLCRVSFRGRSGSTPQEYKTVK